MSKSGNVMRQREAGRAHIKRVWAMILCLLMLVGLLPAQAFAALTDGETVTAVAAPAHSEYTVDVGTALADADLPGELTVTVSTPPAEEGDEAGTRTENAAVEWKGDYDADKAGEYTLTAAFKDDALSFGKMPQVQVTVKAKEKEAAPATVQKATAVEEEKIVFEPQQLNLDPDSKDNDCELVPEFYATEDYDEEEMTASLFSFTAQDSEETYYRIYGSFGVLTGFFDCDKTGKSVKTDAVVSDTADLNLYEGNVAKKGAVTNNVPVTLNSGSPESQSKGGGVDQALVATITTKTTNAWTGAFGQVELYSSLSSTDNDEYAIVRVPITNTPPELSFSQFVLENGKWIYNVVRDEKSFVLELVKDGNGVPKYIEYRIDVGDQFNALIRCVVPNGYSLNTSDVTFEEPVAQLEEGQPTFTGGTAAQGDVLEFKARFEWQPVDIFCNKASTTVRMIGGVPKLTDNINYTITAANSYNGYTSGVIFTAGYTLQDTITLPEGVAFPTGAAVLSSDGETVTIGGVTVATFNKKVESVSVSGNELTFSYAVDNATLDASGNPVSGRTAEEIENLSLSMTLNATNLVVTDANAATGKMIVHDTVFDAVPCKQAATAAHSTDVAETIITAPSNDIQLTKTNTPDSDTIILDTDTPITYTVVAKNPGITSQTVTVRDTFPAHTVYVAGSGSTDAVTPTVSGTEISWANVEIGPNETKSFSFRVKVSPGTADNTRIENRASASYGNDKTALSNTVENTYDARDRVELKKTTTTVSVYWQDVIPYTITVTNKNDAPTAAHDITDTMQPGLELSEAQLAAIREAYGSGVTYIENTTTGGYTITIPNVSLGANQKKTFSFNATVVDKFDDNDAITNTAYINDLNLQSEAAVEYRTRKADLAVTKTYGTPRQVAADLYEIDFHVAARNVGVDMALVDKPVPVKDVMSAGLRPAGAGDTATEGTTTGTDSRGQTITGNWVRTGSAAPYTYTITWPDCPILNTGDSYWIEYKGEVKVELVGGTFQPITVSNVASFGLNYSGVYPVISAPFSIAKTITGINATTYTPGIKKSPVYAGDVLTYLIEIGNSKNTAVTGTVTDTLPRLLTDDSWQYVDTMAAPVVDYSVDVIAGAAPDGPSVQNGKLVWSNAVIPANGTLSYIIQLAYPDDGFFAALGAEGEVFTNNVEFAPADGSQKISDYVSHTSDDLKIGFNKTVTPEFVDASSATLEDKQAVFTLSGFDVEHVAHDFSVLDNLDDVRKKCEITAINYGVYDFATIEGTTGYNVIITYADNTTSTHSADANLEFTPTYATGKTVADVLSVKWDFGNIRHLSVETDPTVTVTARDSVSGKGTNNMFLAYNNTYEMKSASVSVGDGNQLRKTLYDADGNAVNNADNRVTLNTSGYTYEIKLANTTDAAIDLSTATFTDTYNSQTLVGGATATFELTAAITGADGTVKTAPVLENSTVQGAAVTATSAAFPIAFTSGTLAVGDTLTIRYNVETNGSIAISDADPAAGVQNKISAVLEAGAGMIEAQSGPFFTEGAAYVYMQKSVVGELVWTTQDAYALQGHPFYYASNCYVINYEDQVFDNETVVEAVNVGQHSQVLYNVTIVNSEKSTVSITAPSNSGAKITDRIVGMNRLGLTDPMHNYFGVYFRSYRHEVFSRRSLSFITDVDKFNDGVGNRPITNKLSGEQLNLVKISDNLKSFDADVAGGGASAFLQSIDLAPGEAITFFFATNTEHDPSYTGDTISNTMSFNISDDQSDDSSVHVPEGAKVYFDDGYDLDIPTFSNKANQENVSSMPSKHGDSGITMLDDGKTYKVWADAEVKRPKYDLSITKKIVGFIPEADLEELKVSDTEWYYAGTDNDIDDYVIPINPLNPEPNQDEVPGLADAIVCQIVVSNPNDYAMEHLVLKDYLPDPYWCLWFNRTIGHGLRVSSEPAVDTPVIAEEEIALGPNEKKWYYLVMAPRTNPADPDLVVDYESYENRAELAPIYPSNHVRSVEKGTPIYDEGKITGAYASDTVTIGGKYASKSYKSVISDETPPQGETNPMAQSNTETRVITVEPDGTFTYALNVENKSQNFNFEDFVMIERLPKVGDVGTINQQSQRGSEFGVDFANDNIEVLLKPSGTDQYTTVPAANYSVGYNKVNNAAYSEDDWEGVSTWGAFAEDADSVRIELGIPIPDGAAVRVKFHGKVHDPANVNPEWIAWNTFGYHYTINEQGVPPRLLIAEPAKVGVRIGGARLQAEKAAPNAEGTGTIPLAGATFAVYETLADAQSATATPVATFTTGADGIGQTTNRLNKQIWYVKETVAPEGYLPSTTIYTVDLTNANDNAVVNITSANDGKVINATAPVSLTLTKAFEENTTLPADGTVVTVSVRGDFYGIPQTATISRTFTYKTAPEDNQCNGVYTQELTDQLIPGNTYTITETVANGTQTYDYTFAATATDAASRQITIDNGAFSPLDDTTVHLVNSATVAGKLRVKKIVSGTDGGETFQIKIEGRFDDNEDGYKYVSVAPADRQTNQESDWIEVGGVIANETYTVTEPFGADNYNVAIRVNNVDVQGVTMPAGADSGVDVVVTNTRKPAGKLIVQKKVDGVIPTTDVGEFTIEVTAAAGSFTDGDEKVTETRTLNFANQYRTELSNLKTGVMYTVTEVNVAANYAVDYDGLDDQNRVMAGETNVTVEVDNRTTTQLTIDKTVRGFWGSKTEEFAFTVTLTDANNQPLTGPYNYTGGVIEGVTDVTAPDNGTITLTDGVSSQFVLKHGQSITITNLPVHTTYTVTEVQANQNGYTTFASDASKTDMTTKATASFINTREMITPTGVILDVLPYLIIVLLAAGGAVAAIVLARRRRKKARKDRNEW